MAMWKGLGTILAVLGAVALAAGGCGDDPGEGTLEVRIYGEEFIEEGIPADETDGWEIAWDSFLVHVSDVTAARGSGEPGFADATGRVFDLTAASQGVGHAVTSATVPSGAYDRVAYRVSPASADSVAGNASAADVATMVDGGLALYAAGTATKGAEVKRFAWAFAAPTRYAECESEARVPAGGTGTAQLTIHADHLFYDDLVSEEPNVAFDLIAAADTDGDGEVTQAELAALDITGEARYQVGNRTDITDLWAFITAQVATVGHIDGEGHCEAVE